MTPLLLRGTFRLTSQQDIEEGLVKTAPTQTVLSQPISLPAERAPEGAEVPPNQPMFRVVKSRAADSVSLSKEAVSNPD
jgi:hypothetical protein